MTGKQMKKLFVPNPLDVKMSMSKFYSNQSVDCSSKNRIVHLVRTSVIKNSTEFIICITI